MQLTVWTYEGPPHVGAMRIATAMEGVHYVLHAPQGDTYADLLFTMIERRDKRPPVTYTTFQARDLGGDTAELFKSAAREAYERFKPQAMLVGASCTAELIQDDPGGLAEALNLPIPVIALELPAYQKKENWGAAETFYRLVRTCVTSPMLRQAQHEAVPVAQHEGGSVNGLALSLSKGEPHKRPICNILGPTALGFRHRDDVTEIKKLLGELGVSVNVVAPLGATPADLARLPQADFNISLYPEIAGTAAAWLEKTFKQPCIKTVPIGVGATEAFIAEVQKLAFGAVSASSNVVPASPVVIPAKAGIHNGPALEPEMDSRLRGNDTSISASSWPGLARPSSLTENVSAPLSLDGLKGGHDKTASRLPWYSRSVDSTYLTGKRVFVFGDATHAVAAARVASAELAFKVVGLGTYSREYAREVREAAKLYDVEPLITDDYLEVEARVKELQPELVLGTQMERHIAKRLGIPCAVISAPVHVQDFPARYSPQMGFEGANVLFDTWVHPLMMGLEEHLLGMFREDFEFHDGAKPSHLASVEPSADEMSFPRKRESIEQHSPELAAEMDPRLRGDDSGKSGDGNRSVSHDGELAGFAWGEDAEKELRKIPFFVRGKARRNTERFAAEQGITNITVETLYDAKAHFSR